MDSINETALRKAFQAVKTDMDDLKKKITVNLQLIDDFNKRFEKLVTKKGLKEKLDSLKETLGKDDLKKQTKDISLLKEAVLTVESKKANLRDVENLFTSIDELKQKLGDVSEEKSDVKEFEGLRNELNTLQENSADTKELNSLSKNVSSLNKELKSVEANVKEIYSVKKEFRKFNKNSAYYDEQIKELDQKANELSYLKLELKESEKKLDRLTGLKSDVEELKKNSVTSAYFSQQTDNLNRDLLELKKELKDVDNDGVDKHKFNSVIDQMQMQSKRLNFLEQSLKEETIANMELQKDIEYLSKQLNVEKKFGKKRIVVEKKYREYKDEQVDSIKSMVLFIFIGLLAFGIAAYFFTGKNPFAFPGLIGKLVLVCIILFILLIVLFFPYKKVFSWFQEGEKPKKEEKVVIKPKKAQKEAVQTQEYIKKAIDYVFIIALVLFLTTLVVNEFYALKFMNTTYFLIFVVVFGILSVIFPVKEEAKKISYWLTGLIALAAAVFIYAKTKQFGWLSYLIAVVSGILIFLISTVVFEEEKPVEKKKNKKRKSFMDRVADFFLED